MSKLIILTSPSDYGISVLKTIAKSEENVVVLDCIGIPIFNHFNYSLATYLKWIIFKKQKAGFNYINKLKIYQRSQVKRDLFVAIKSKMEYGIISGKPFHELHSVTLNFYEKRVVNSIIKGLESIISDFEEVICFNGRSLVLRLASDVCKRFDKDFSMYELWGSEDGSIRFKKIESTFTLEKEAKRVADIQPEEDEIVRVDRYLSNRFNGKDELLNFWNSLGTSHSNRDLLSIPQDIDVLFCFSSEDEYFGKWSHKKVLDKCYSQVDTVRDLFIRYGEDYKDLKFVFKMHPRINDKFLKRTKRRYSVLKDFLQNSGFNVTFISTEEDVYSLIGRTKLVLGFGSPVIEAAYFGKPSVLLGPTLFMYTNSVYTAQNLGEINNYILNIPSPRERDGLYQYFLYWISNGQKISK